MKYGFTQQLITSHRLILTPATMPIQLPSTAILRQDLYPAATGTADVPAIQRPELSIVKSTTATSFIAPNEIITYTLIVTNTGNVTITGITVSDPNAVVTCLGAPYTLVPGAQATCTATHTVTVADVAATIITNTATVTGSDPRSNPVTGTSNTVTVPAPEPASSYNLSDAYTDQLPVNIAAIF